MNNPCTISDRAPSTPFEGWVILEIMGHRKLGGYIKEDTIAGMAYVRFDGFNEKEEVVVTQFYNPTSVYCITPVSKEIALTYGIRNQPAPVQQWEIPGLNNKNIAAIASASTSEDEQELYIALNRTPTSFDDEEEDDEPYPNYVTSFCDEPD